MKLVLQNIGSCEYENRFLNIGSCEYEISFFNIVWVVRHLCSSVWITQKLHIKSFFRGDFLYFSISKNYCSMNLKFVHIHCKPRLLICFVLRREHFECWHFDSRQSVSRRNNKAPVSMLRSQFSEKKIGVFLKKTMSWSIFCIISLCLESTMPFFAIFSENIFF
jgi:hypothetical protein